MKFIGDHPEHPAANLTAEGSKLCRLVGVLGNKESRVIVYTAQSVHYPEVPACVLLIGGMSADEVARGLIETVGDDIQTHFKNLALLVEEESTVMAQMVTGRVPILDLLRGSEER